MRQCNARPRPPSKRTLNPTHTHTLKKTKRLFGERGPRTRSPSTMATTTKTNKPRANTAPSHRLLLLFPPLSCSANLRPAPLCKPKKNTRALFLKDSRYKKDDTTTKQNVRVERKKKKDCLLVSCGLSLDSCECVCENVYCISPPLQQDAAASPRSAGRKRVPRRRPLAAPPLFSPRYVSSSPCVPPLKKGARALSPLGRRPLLLLAAGCVLRMC